MAERTSPPSRPPSQGDVDHAFAAVAQRRSQEAQDTAAHDQASSALWYAHHWPHRYERCVMVAGKPVCRRCSWLYSIAFITLALGFAGVSPWPSSLDTVLLWVLCVPATIEFIGGELGAWSYSPRRQVAVTALFAPAVGRGFYLELTEGPSLAFWGPAVVFGLCWFAVGVYAWTRKTGQYR